MPESVLGLPLHPLVVHAAVVLVPLAALMTIVIAVDPARRARFGVLTWLLAAAATTATFAARMTGQELAAAVYPRRVPAPVVDHQSFGQSSPWYALALLGGATALLLLDRDRKRRPGLGSALLPSVLSVVVVLVAMAATIQVVWTGWTGAEARWGGVVVESLPLPDLPAR
ncbi:MAG: hypothetical protein OEW53_09905 [Actinomycetota bacterium]|nr:hypothetical protein [Actinomycetota bacterium]